MKSQTGVELMRELEPLRVLPTLAFPTPTPLPGETSKTHVHVVSTRKTRNRTIWQFVRFGLVGCLNTTIDLLMLNCLLQLWPTQNIARLLLFNTIAYACGALNSFALNRYWTFRRAGRPKAREGARFLLITLAAIACNDLLPWVFVQSSHDKRERFVHPRTWQHEELPDKTASDHALVTENTGVMIHTDKIPAAILPDCHANMKRVV